MFLFTSRAAESPDSATAILCWALPVRWRKIDPDLRGTLKREGFLSRDARVKERKKAWSQTRTQGTHVHQALEPICF